MNNDILSQVNYLLIQTIAVGGLNLIIPLLFRNHKKLLNYTLVIISIAYLINVVNLNHFYLHGGRVSMEVMQFSNIHIKIHLEALGLIFLSMIALLWPMANIYTIGYLDHNNITNQPRFLFFMTCSIMAASMVALSANLMTMFIMYELLTLSTAPLIAHEATDHAKKSLKKYLAILMSTSLLFWLPVILFIQYKVGNTDFVAKGILSGVIDRKIIMILFICTIFGCAKAAIMPFHGWLPAAMVASYPVSALLHAVAVVKAGLFVIYKMVIYIYGLEVLHEIFSEHISLIIILISGILLGSIFAMRQPTVKKMLAYSTISQLNFALIGIFLFTPKGFYASVLHMVAHSFGKITLFFSAGNIFSVTSRSKIEEMKGVAFLMPKTFKFFSIASLSLIGIPPLAGFISKYYMLSAVTENNINYIALTSILIGTILTATYLFKVIHLAYQPIEIDCKDLTYNLPWGMKFATGFCALLSVIFVILVQYLVRIIETINVL